MNLSDTECMLMMQNSQDRSFAAREITKANAEIRRLAGLLRDARADLEEAEAELKTERAARLLAEYNLNKRH